MGNVRAASSVLFVLGFVPLVGCTTLAKQAYNEARGAQAKVLPIQETGPATMGRIRGYEFAPATTTVGAEICPPQLLSAYDRATSRLASRLGSDTGPSLKVDSEVLYFQGKGLLSGAFMLTRVRMRDGERLISDVLVRAESGSYTRGGEDALAIATVDALGRFLRVEDRPE